MAYNRYELAKWAAHCFDLAPRDFDGEDEADMLWDVAHYLLCISENAQTAAHLLTGLRWDVGADRPALQRAARRLTELRRPGMTMEQLKAACAGVDLVAEISEEPQ